MNDFIGEQNDRLDRRQLAVYPTVMLLQEVYDRVEQLEKERNKLRHTVRRLTDEVDKASRQAPINPYRHDIFK